jgi:amino-acid N-acetyltransferase
MIRKAELGDIRAIHVLIAEQAKVGNILPRAISELYSQLRDFTVYTNDETREIIGCGALHIVWEDLAEIRSLAVATAHQHRGVGSQLTEALLEESRQMGIKRVFVLTDRTRLFERMGFALMDKGDLPHKIWADCIRCSKFPECDEVALARIP